MNCINKQNENTKQQSTDCCLMNCKNKAEQKTRKKAREKYNNYLMTAL